MLQEKCINAHSPSAHTYEKSHYVDTEKKTARFWCVPLMCTHPLFARQTFCCCRRHRVRHSIHRTISSSFVLSSIFFLANLDVRKILYLAIACLSLSSFLFRSCFHFWRYRKRWYLLPNRYAPTLIAVFCSFLLFFFPFFLSWKWTKPSYVHVNTYYNVFDGREQARQRETQNET